MEAVYLVKFELFAVNNSSAKIIEKKKGKVDKGAVMKETLIIEWKRYVDNISTLASWGLFLSHNKKDDRMLAVWQ